MKIVIIFLFCVIAGFSLGVFASIGFSQSEIVLLATLAGGITGIIYAILGSLVFLWKRNHPNIFTILLLCYLFSAPVALIAGFSGNQLLAVGLIVSVIFGTFLVLIKKNSSDVPQLLANKAIYIVSGICLTIAAVLAYRYEAAKFPTAVPALIEMMASNDEAVQMGAARKLRAYGKEPFLVALTHKNANVRREAAHFLGLVGDPTAQDALINAAGDEDAHVRMWVAFSLGKIGNERALPTLNQLAKDDQEIVRRHAKQAIEELQKRQGR